jgi:hypothetical protein
MVPGLLAFADALDLRREHERATRLRARALLLAPDGAAAPEVTARLRLDDAQRGLARGIADPAQLDRIDAAALRRDSPRLERIRAHIAERTERPSPYFYRLVAALGITLFALGSLGLLAVRALAPGRMPGAGRKQGESKGDAEEGDGEGRGEEPG